MTCNVTELQHHIGWFDNAREVICVDDSGKRYEIVELLDVDQSPVLKIREARQREARKSDGR